jgi:hypothetical protein
VSIPNPIDHDRRLPKAGERPNGRRRLCGEAKRADARAGVSGRIDHDPRDLVSHDALGARRGPGQLADVSPAARHALLYATQFFAFGVILPFLPAVMAARGLDPAEIALVLALGSAVRLVAGPLGGRLADVLAAPRAVLAMAAAVSALAASGYLVAAGFGAMLVVHAALSIGMAPIVPLSDAVTIAAARGAGADGARRQACNLLASVVASVSCAGIIQM